MSLRSLWYAYCMLRAEYHDVLASKDQYTERSRLRIRTKRRNMQRARKLWEDEVKKQKLSITGIHLNDKVRARTTPHVLELSKQFKEEGFTLSNGKIFTVKEPL